MSSDAPMCLADFVRLQRGTTYKGNLLGLPGPVLLGLASIQPNGGFRRGSFKTYGGESPAKITLNPGDIYVSLKDVTQSGDLLGAVARIPADIQLGRLTQDTVKLDFHGRAIDRNYIYWLLRTPRYREYCRARGTGTTTLGLARDDFLSFPVPEPDDASLSLVALLEALDDRIDLLRETNATLEAIVQTLFKSWFVDFDPVRAKQEGRVPECMDEATAAMFPDSLQESDLGWTPSEWRIARLDEIATVLMGLSPTGDSYNSDGHGVPLINGPVEFGEYFPVKSKWTHAATRFAIAHDLIFCVRGSTTGRRVIADDEYCIGRGVCAIRPLNSWNNFIYQTINTGLGRLLEKTTGSVFPSLSAPDIKTFKVLRPPDEVVIAFENTSTPLLEQVQRNHRTVETLTALRDALVPRLIMGELCTTERAAKLANAA